MNVTTTELGSGSYFISDAARIARVNSRSLKRWALGYDYTYRQERLASPPLLQSKIPSVNGEEFLTFQQLVEVMFIGLFRAHGVSVPVIRAVAHTAASRYKTNHPFAIENLQTDGKTIFADSVQVEHPMGISKARITEDLHRGQLVIRDFAQPYFRKIDYVAMEAARYWPVGKEGGIVIDPQRSFGSPIDNGSGVPTSVLYGMYKAGERTEAIAEWYKVDQASVISSIEFETSLLRAA